MIDEKRRVICEFLNDYPFEGSSANKEDSLFEDGFVYDSGTGILITTKPSYYWEMTGDEIMFSVTKLEVDNIDGTFSDNMWLLEGEQKSESDWIEMCYPYKIVDLDLYVKDFNLPTALEMDKTADDLIKYLTDYNS
jgi:hypothetical protein